MTLTPQRMIADLRELHDLTGDSGGAQRLAWSETWDRARGWLRAKIAALPGVTLETDPAGSLWASLPGASPRALIVGSHLDSVPNGGWLDGALGVAGGLEVLRALAEAGTPPPLTLSLVAWAEEEGTQFGQSDFTSTLAVGGCDAAALAGLGALTDADGRRLADVVGRWGVDLAGLVPGERFPQLDGAAAYLELHIEQGPVLEQRGLALAAVTGAMGIQRHRLRFSGQTAHAGSTPMADRRDALAAAARFALEVRRIAVASGGVGTVGSLVTRPGIVTAVAGQVDLTLDLRHLEGEALAGMLADAQAASLRIANDERVTVDWQRLYAIEPVRFDPALIDLCAAAVAETSGAAALRMPSGPLHDAVALARAGIPSGMMFVQSLRGLSHTREEDTREDHLRLAAQAFYRLVEGCMAVL